MPQNPPKPLRTCKQEQTKKQLIFIIVNLD